MYISKDIAERIKAIAKSSGITVKSMLYEIGLGENTIQNMKKSMPQADSLAMIADYLNVSVDYLLGRDTRKSNSITQSNINGDNSARIDNSSLSEMDNQLLELFGKLPITQKAEIIMKMSEMLSDK